jgi:hypothetical protein
MSFNDNFCPSINAGSAGNAVAGYSSITIAVTNSSAVRAIPPGGLTLELNNSGAADVFVEFGNGTATALAPSGTSLGSYPVRAGQCKLIRRPIGPSGSYCDTIATISGTSSTLLVSVGEGN